MKRQRNHLRNWFAGLCATFVSLGITLAQTPEYLTSEEPIPTTLEETRSATEGIAIDPDSRPLEWMLQRRRYLPELRKLIPRTGEPFFDDAVYHIAPRAYYRYRDDGDGGKSEAFAAGGEFGVETGYLGEVLRFGFTGYTSQNVHGPPDRAGSGLLAPVQKSYTVLGEAYADKTFVGLVGQYGWDMFHSTYLEAEHYREITDDLSLKTGLQFTDQRSVGDELLGRFDAQHFGCKLSLGYQSLILTSAFTWTSGDHGIRKPWGGSPSYNSVMISDFDRPGEQAFRTGISCDFSKLGLKGVAVSASWLYGNTPDSGSDASPDQQESDVNLDYRPTFTGLDNFWLRLRYASNDRDAALDGLDRQDLRLILNYSLSF